MLCCLTVFVLSVMVFPAGVTREQVLTAEDAQGLVRRAAAARAVESTKMNATSSRSHTLFLLYITGGWLLVALYCVGCLVPVDVFRSNLLMLWLLPGCHAAAQQQLEGCLVLVDLAGSERVGRSGAEGDRLKVPSRTPQHSCNIT